jgi:hypothetical protein
MIATGAFAAGAVVVVTAISPDIPVPLETEQEGVPTVPAPLPQVVTVGVAVVATNTLAERAAGTDTSGVSALGKWTNLRVLLGLLPVPRTFCMVHVSDTEAVPFQAVPIS